MPKDIVAELRGCVNYGARLPVNATVLQLMAEAATEIERLRKFEADKYEAEEI